jgi:hypothetical protein
VHRMRSAARRLVSTIRGCARTDAQQHALALRRAATNAAACLDDDMLSDVQDAHDTQHADAADDDDADEAGAGSAVRDESVEPRAKRVHTDSARSDASHTRHGTRPPARRSDEQRREHCRRTAPLVAALAMHEGRYDDVRCCCGCARLLSGQRARRRTRRAWPQCSDAARCVTTSTTATLCDTACSPHRPCSCGIVLCGARACVTVCMCVCAR